MYLCTCFSSRGTCVVDRKEKETEKETKKERAKSKSKKIYKENYQKKEVINRG